MPQEFMIATKQGEAVVKVRLQRTLKGIRLTVWAHPCVEELFRTWSGGAVEDVSIYGRYWDSPERLQVYTTDHGKLYSYTGGQYGLSSPGGVLMSESKGPTWLNLSFLRLVGISMEEGKTFRINEVYGLTELRELSDQIKAACRHFWVEYLMPVDLSMTLSTMSEERKL